MVRYKLIIILILLALLALSSQAWAAHTLDTSQVNNGLTANPATFSYTTGSGTTVLVLTLVVAGGTNRAGTAPTFNNMELSQIDTVRKYASSPESSVEMWYLSGPPIGTYSISIPNTNTRTIHAFTCSAKAQAGYASVLDDYYGTSGNSANPSSASNIVTTVAGDFIVSRVADGYLNLGTGNKTQFSGIWGTDHGAYVSMRMYELMAGTGTTTFTFTETSDDWGMITAAFKEVILPSYKEPFTGSGYSLGTGTPGWAVCSGSPDPDYLNLGNDKYRVDTTSTGIECRTFNYGSNYPNTYATVGAWVKQMDIATNTQCKEIFDGYTVADTKVYDFRVCRNDAGVASCATGGCNLKFEFYITDSTQCTTGGGWSWASNTCTSTDVLSNSTYDFIENPVVLKAKYDAGSGTNGAIEWIVEDLYGNVKKTQTKTGLTSSYLRAGTGKWPLGVLVGTSATTDIIYDNWSLNTLNYTYDAWSFASGTTADCGTGSASAIGDTTCGTRYAAICPLGSSYEHEVKTNWNGSSVNMCGYLDDIIRPTFPDIVYETEITQDYNVGAFENTSDVAPSVDSVERIIEYVQGLSPSRRVRIYNAMYTSDQINLSTKAPIIIDGSFEGIQILNFYTTTTDNGAYIFVFPPYYNSSRTQRYPVLIHNHGTGVTPYEMFYGAAPDPTLLEYVAKSVDEGGTGIIGVIGSLGGEMQQGFGTEWQDSFNQAMDFLYKYLNADKMKIAAFGSSRGGGTSIMQAINSRGTGKQHASYSNSSIYVDSDGRNLSTGSSIRVGQTVNNVSDGSIGTVTSITTTLATNDTLNFSGGMSGGTDNDWDANDILKTYEVMGIFSGAPPTAIGDHSLGENTNWATLEMYYPPYTGYLTAPDDTVANNTRFYSAAYPPHCKGVASGDCGECSVTTATKCSKTSDCPAGEYCKRVAALAKSLVNSDVVATANTNSPYGYVDTATEAKTYLGGRCSATKTTVCAVDADCPGGETCEGEKHIVLSFGTNDSVIPYYTLLQFDEALRYNYPTSYIKHKTCVYIMGGHGGEYGKCIQDGVKSYVEDYLRCANNPSPCSVPALPDKREYWTTNKQTHDDGDTALFHTEEEGMSLLFTVLVPSLLDSNIDVNTPCTSSGIPYGCCTGEGTGTDCTDYSSPYAGSQQPAQFFVSGENGKTWQITLLDSSHTPISEKVWAGTFGQSTYTRNSVSMNCQLYGTEYCLVDDVQFGCSSPPCTYYYEFKYNGITQTSCNTPFYKSGDANCSAYGSKEAYSCVRAGQFRSSVTGGADIFDQLKDTTYCSGFTDVTVPWTLNMGITSLLPNCGDAVCQSWETGPECPQDCHKDNFNRDDSATLGSGYWVEDTSYLSDYNDTAISDSDNTGIAHWAYPNADVTQYGKFKISTTSTDGEIGAILRSGASSGYRYALVHEEGILDRLVWKRYNWNTPVDDIDNGTKTLATGENTIHAFIYADGRLWASTYTEPAKLIRFNNSNDLSDYDVITFDNDGVHDHGIDLIYSTSKDKIYIIFSDSAQVTISEVDPDTLAWIDVKEDTGEAYGSSLTTDESYIYVASSVSPAKVLKYSLSDWSKTTKTITESGNTYCIRYDGTNLYITFLTTPSGIAKMNPSDLTYTYQEFQSGDDYAADDFAFTTDYVWVGLEDSSGIIEKIAKSNLAITRINTSQTSDCYGVFYDGTYIWAPYVGTPGIIKRITPGDSSIATYTMKTGENDPNEMAFVGNDKYITCYLSPAKVIISPDISDNDSISEIIMGTGTGTVIRAWKNATAYEPYNATNWDSSSDPADYVLRDNGGLLATNPADTGLYTGILIKKETGIASPALDDFYSGDTSEAEGYSGGIMRGIMRGVCR